MEFSLSLIPSQGNSSLEMCSDRLKVSIFTTCTQLVDRSTDANECMSTVVEVGEVDWRDSERNERPRYLVHKDNRGKHGGPSGRASREHPGKIELVFP
jgi:hypothetical protein